MSSHSCVDHDPDFDLKFSMSGLNWVGKQARKTGRPSVASMSLQGGAFQPVDDMVTKAIHLFSFRYLQLTFGIVGQIRCSCCGRRSVAALSNLCIDL